MNLRNVCIRVVESPGLSHQIALRGLRLYLKEHTEAEIIKEIHDITEAPLLRALWEAGLRKPFYDAALYQLGKVR